MDLKTLFSEDFTKKSNKVLLDVINQLDADNRLIISELEKLLDKQDLLFSIYDKIMNIISTRTGNAQ